MKRNNNRRNFRRGKAGLDILTIAAQRATADAVYQHLVDLTYEKLKDRNWVKFVEEWISENFPIPPKNNGKNHKGKGGF